MTYKFNVTNAQIRNVKRLIESSGFDYEDVVAFSEDESVLKIRVQLQTASPIFQLSIQKDDRTVATAMSPCCLPLDAVFISGANDIEGTILTALLKELDTLSARFLRQLELPIRLFEPSTTPVFIQDPQANSLEEGDLYSTVAYLNDELHTQTPIEEGEKLKEKKLEKEQNLRARNRLLKYLSFRNSSIFHIARQRSVPWSKLSTAFLEGIAVLSLENADSNEFRALGPEEISDKKSLLWSKLRYRRQRDSDTAIYCHIETDSLGLNIYFAEVSRTSNTNFDIRKCIVKTLDCGAQREKPNAAGRVITQTPGIVYDRVKKLFTDAQSNPTTVNEYFLISTELLYYVGKINETSVPKYKTPNGSYVDVFPLLQKYLLSVLLTKNADSVWVYRFKNMVKMQKTCPSFWGIVPFLNSQI